MTQTEKQPVLIKVNDNKIPTNPFVTEVVKNVVLGLISSLKLKEEPHKIEITVEL